VIGEVITRLHVLHSITRNQLTFCGSTPALIVGATTAACLSSESVNAFLCDDRNHHQSGNGIHPPPTKQRIQQQATQENPGKVCTEICLFRIGVHGSAANLTSNSPFRSRQQRHDNHRSARDHDAGDASLRWNVLAAAGEGAILAGQRGPLRQW